MGAMIRALQGLTLGGRLALLVSLCWLFSLAACSGGGGCLPSFGVRHPPPEPAPPPSPTRVEKITLEDNSIDMPRVLPPGPTRFIITNQGKLPHYLEIRRLGTDIMFGLDLLPGDVKPLLITLAPGRYRVWCPFNRTAAGAMALEVTVTPHAAPASPR
jgi:hypothetical protein